VAAGVDRMQLQQLLLELALLCAAGDDEEHGATGAAALHLCCQWLQHNRLRPDSLAEAEAVLETMWVGVGRALLQAAGASQQELQEHGTPRNEERQQQTRAAGVVAGGAAAAAMWDDFSAALVWTFAWMAGECRVCGPAPWLVRVGMCTCTDARGMVHAGLQCLPAACSSCAGVCPLCGRADCAGDAAVGVFMQHQVLRSRVLEAALRRHKLSLGPGADVLNVTKTMLTSCFPSRKCTGSDACLLQRSRTVSSSRRFCSLIVSGFKAMRAWAAEHASFPVLHRYRWSTMELRLSLVLGSCSSCWWW
jgi:hypothetical protein